MISTAREYLDSSSIHGLAYISSSQNIPLKCFWGCVVLGGVIGAIFIIQESFVLWRNHPIATSTETFPISEATFPRVTVCPPDDSNTVLNYDLMKASNMTISKDVREEMFKAAGEFYPKQCTGTHNH